MHDLAAGTELHPIEEINRQIQIFSEYAPTTEQLNNRVITLWLLYDMREQALVVRPIGSKPSGECAPPPRPGAER